MQAGYWGPSTPSHRDPCCPLQSVINRTLLQRQEVLKDTVKQMEGEGTPVGQWTVNASVQLLLPGQGLRLPNFQQPGESYSERATCSERCTTLDQIETMFRASTDLKVCACLNPLLIC